MGLADLFSSIVSTVYADAPEEKEEQSSAAEEPAEEPAAEAEEEEEEPEDVRCVTMSDASFNSTYRCSDYARAAGAMQAVCEVCCRYCCLCAL